MIGFNSRETCQDATFDIQTQDLTANRVLETRIYRNGKILAIVRRPYAEDEAASSIHEKMSRQQEEICEKVRDGTYGLIFLWISRGVIAHESRDYLKALECFESVLAIDETNEEVKEHLAGIRSVMEDDAEIRKGVRESLQKKVNELFQTGRYMEASRKEALLSQLGLSDEPAAKGKKQKPAKSRSTPFSFPHIHLRRIHVISFLFVVAGFCALILGIGFIRTDNQLEPDDQAKITSKDLESDQVSAARSIFQQISMEAPLTHEAVVEFWNTFESKGDYEEAAGMLEELSQRGTSSPELSFFLAEAYRLTSRCEQAIPFYQKALQQGLPASDGNLGMGLCLLQQKKFER